MLGDVDTIDFVLAEKLGMSLAQVGELSNAEIVAWRAYLKFRHAMDNPKVVARGGR